MNGIAFPHQHMHKVLDALQSKNYLGPCKSQDPQTYKAALTSSELIHWKKTIQSKYDFFIENETWDLTRQLSNRKVPTDRLMGIQD